MHEIAESILLVYAGLFPIVNPVGGAPIFLSYTRHCAPGVRHRLAGLVALNGFFLLLGSLFVGSHVLQFFGISLPVVRIAGGLVVASFGWTLLNAKAGSDERGTDAQGGPRLGADDAFYPLTMPLTIGPGSISVAITLGSDRPSGASLEHLAVLGAAAIVGLAAIALTIYVCYRFAERLVAALGAHGTTVLVRLSAFILLCIGIQILWSGISELIAQG